MILTVTVNNILEGLKGMIKIYSKLKKYIVEDTKGSVTIVFCLSLCLIIMLMLVVLEVARVFVAKSEVSIRTIAGTESIMAEYDPNIYECYHLFLFDTGYGSGNHNNTKVTSNLKSNMENALTYEKDSDKGDTMIDMRIDKVDVTYQSNISSADELKKQCSKYMQFHSDANLYSSIKNISADKSDEKVLWIEYILGHFKSYINRKEIDTLKRNNIYEIEEMIYAKGVDNDNLEACIYELTGDIEVSSDKIDEIKYKKLLITKLTSMNEKILAEKLLKIMLDNINKNFFTNVKKENCYCKLKVKATLSIPSKLNIPQYSNGKVTRKTRYVYDEEYEYSY